MKKILIIAVILLTVSVSAVIASVPQTVNQHQYPAGITVISQSDSGGRQTEGSVTVKPGDYFKVELTASGGTGYQWNLRNEQLAHIELIEKAAGPVNKLFPMPGGREKWEFYLRAKEDAVGQEILQFCLARGWEKDDPSAKEFLLTVVVQDQSGI